MPDASKGEAGQVATATTPATPATTTPTTSPATTPPTTTMTPPVRKISKSMPCKRRRPTSLIECHFEVSEDFELLGALRHDPNVQRDVHDWFNLIFLVPLVVLD